MSTRGSSADVHWCILLSPKDDYIGTYLFYSRLASDLWVHCLLFALHVWVRIDQQSTMASLFSAGVGRLGTSQPLASPPGTRPASMHTARGNSNSMGPRRASSSTGRVNRQLALVFPLLAMEDVGMRCLLREL